MNQVELHLSAIIFKFYKFFVIISCFLLFFTSCLFVSYSVFCFISSKIKVNELRKKQEIHSKKYSIK